MGGRDNELPGLARLVIEKGADAVKRLDAHLTGVTSALRRTFKRLRKPRLRRS